MGERWASIILCADESLRCHSCYENAHNQKVHLHLNVDDEIDEIMCDSCWKDQEGKE
jgi:hypothetical protein